MTDDRLVGCYQGWHTDSADPTRHITLTMIPGVCIRYQGAAGAALGSVSAYLGPEYDGDFNEQEHGRKVLNASTHKIIVAYRFLLIPKKGVHPHKCTGTTMMVIYCTNHA